MQQCPDGYYSLSMASSCSICPAGQYCFDGTNHVTPANCAAGEYSARGESTCSTCESGTVKLRHLRRLEAHFLLYMNCLSLFTDHQYQNSPRHKNKSYMINYEMSISSV